MTTDDELVERVAKAIHEAHRNAPYPWWHVEAEHCRVAPHLARAAIAAISTEADRISLLREALEEIAEGDWYRTPDPPHNIDGSNRKVAGKWANIARQALASSGGGG